MLSIAIDELETQASEIVRAVREQQIEYLITDQGVPVARLAPLTESDATPEPDEEASPPKTKQEVAEEIRQMLRENQDLPPKNRRAMELMAEWLTDPETEDEEWWAEFNAGLEQHRFRLRPETLPI